MLKQAPGDWILKIDSFFKHLEFKKCEMEYGVYVQHTSNGNVILMCLYVDDILMAGGCTFEINKFRKVLMNAFDMTGLGNMVYFIEMKIVHFEKEIIMHQLKYEHELLKIFEMMNCKSAVTPAKTNHKLDSDADGEDINVITFKLLVGCLIYLCNTMPDICYVVGMINRFMSKAKWSHYQVVVRILRYVKGTLRSFVSIWSGR